MRFPHGPDPNLDLSEPIRNIGASSFLKKKWGRALNIFETVDQALDFAISEEEKAARFYLELSGKVSRSGIRGFLRAFAEEEEEHKAKLLEIKSGAQMLQVAGAIQDLKIGDYFVDVDSAVDMGYQDSLIIAMKKEKAAYRLYTDLAGSAPSPLLRDAFLTLAREEANHKLRFELEYDDEVLTEN